MHLIGPQLMDEADRSQQSEEMHKQLGLNRRVPRPQTPSTCTHCVDCGEPIPDARKAAVPETKHCTFCAEELERKEARR